MSIASENHCDLSVILLTWNSRRFLDECLRSLRQAVQGLKYELVVVDNNSYDDSVQRVLQIFPQAKLIRNDRNRGVGPARNQGLAVAKGRYLWLLDVDTRLVAGDVGELILFMDNNPQVGLAGCKLVYPDGSLQPSCRTFPTVLSKALRRLPAWFLQGQQAKEYYSSSVLTDIREVDYVIGASQLIRKQAFEQVGFLDNAIFYGPEDVDYCLRLWKAGWKVTYYPLIAIVHYEQRITKGFILNWTTVRHFGALFYYFRKHRYWFSRKTVYRQFASSKHSLYTKKQL